MHVRALLAAVALIAATALVPACDDAGADTEGAAHDAGGRDGAPPARNFDEYGVWVDPGSSDERPVDPLVLRYGEPTLLYATEEGVFRWDGAAHEATALLPPTAGGGFDFPAEQSADGDALLVLVQQALFVVPVSAGEPVELARDVSVFG